MENLQILYSLYFSELRNNKLVRIVVLGAKGKKICAELFESTRMGLNLTKEALNFEIDAPSLDATMAQEDRHQVMSSMTKDSLEALSAFSERRAPKYQDK